MNIQFLRSWKFWSSWAVALVSIWMVYWYDIRPWIAYEKCFSPTLENSIKLFFELSKNEPDIDASLAETAQWHTKIKKEVENYRIVEYEKCMLKNGVKKFSNPFLEY